MPDAVLDHRIKRDMLTKTIAKKQAVLVLTHSCIFADDLEFGIGYDDPAQLVIGPCITRKVDAEIVAHDERFGLERPACVQKLVTQRENHDAAFLQVKL